MDCEIICIDQDPLAIERAMELASRPEYRGRLFPIHSRFGNLRRAVAEHTGSDVACLDGILFDIGLSSNQIDDPARGFSFRRDGPLDMRMGSRGSMDRSRQISSVLTAEAVINNYSENELHRIIAELGEDKNSRKIARAIANARTNAYIRTTMQLSTIIAKALGQEEAWQHQGGKHPAMRTIRIYINDELRELTRGLVAAEHLLRPDARCVVLTFHSLEDRIAKRFFRACEQGVTAAELPPPMSQQQARRAAARAGGREASMAAGDEDTDAALARGQPSMRALTHKAIMPDEQEMDENARSRSAKLRAARRTEHPPVHADERR
ncbi:hypothetical protein HK105_203355 [Polyrhizophydium stewartii]|uniref:Uncharacterized protein n=1 Tax=Polyrhizophydium stewartii TaxID=2732419 RepID=A0ABR4NBN8_9FUNG